MGHTSGNSESCSRWSGVSCQTRYGSSGPTTFVCVWNFFTNSNCYLCVVTGNGYLRIVPVRPFCCVPTNSNWAMSAKTRVYTCTWPVCSTRAIRRQTLCNVSDGPRDSTTSLWSCFGVLAFRGWPLIPDSCNAAVRRQTRNSRSTSCRGVVPMNRYSFRGNAAGLSGNGKETLCSFRNSPIPEYCNGDCSKNGPVCCGSGFRSGVSAFTSKTLTNVCLSHTVRVSTFSASYSHPKGVRGTLAVSRHSPCLNTGSFCRVVPRR